MATFPLNRNQIIVDSEGRPTPEFLRWFQEQFKQNELTSSASGVSNLLDLIGDAHGVVLYRDETEWAVLSPGTAGRVLQTAGPDADPVWALLTFAGLSDTPADYSGQAGRVVLVNSGEDGLEFGALTFLALSDTPTDFSGQAGNAVVVNSGEDGLEFGTVSSDFITLTDTPGSYSGAGGEYARVNPGEDALIFDVVRAVDVTFDNSASSLNATNVQAALNELRNVLSALVSVDAEVYTLNEYVIVEPSPLATLVKTLNEYVIVQPGTDQAVVRTLNEYVIVEDNT